MTKDQAIEVLIAHAKRCPEPEPCERGYPEDIREDSMAAVAEAVVERKVLARYCPNLGGNCAMLDICTRSDRCELIKRS